LMTRWVGEKIKNVAQPIFLLKLIHNFYPAENRSPNILATSVIKNYTKQTLAQWAKIRPI
jgi:hypothetical protein